MKYLVMLSLLLVACAEDGKNGANGVNGTNATQSPVSISSLVDPCGDRPNVLDEVFLRLVNGTLVASFSANSNGDNTRLVVILPGTYTTTDGDNCTFTVNSSLQLINESHQN